MLSRLRCAGIHIFTGTNFIVRSNALREVGGSPTFTLTEDFALGMNLKTFGWHCRYVQVCSRPATQLLNLMAVPALQAITSVIIYMSAIV